MIRTLAEKSGVVDDKGSAMFFFKELLRRRSVREFWLRMLRHRQIVYGFGLLFGVIVAHTSLFYWFEHTKGSKNATITMFDSLWVTLTTITTVGYGDISASTVGGRISTVLLGYLMGLSLFAWVGSEIVSRLFENMLNRRRGMSKKMKLQGHYLIVNFPSSDKVRLLIEQLRANVATAMTPIVVICDNIEMLPFEYDQVHFLRGSVTNPDTYLRANIAQASHAIVLAMDHEDPSCDAITAAAVSTMEALNPTIRTVAECVFEAHLPLFRHVNCDRIVLAGDLLIKLIIQETQDEVAAKAISQLLEQQGDEFYSVRVGEFGAGHSFREIVWSLMNAKQQVLAVGFKRGQELALNPPRDTVLNEDDALILLADKDPAWEHLPPSLFDEKKE